MVRRLAAADAEAYAMLRREMLLEAPLAFTASPESDVASDAARVAAALAQPGFAILAAFEQAELAAVAGLDREKQPKRAHLAWVWGVYTRPSSRRRGLGRKVVSAAIEAARGWPGVAGVQLAVSERSGAARALYESLGFVAWGVEPDAVRVGGQSSAETHMRLTF